ncbi:MAG: glycoside hydrolase family 2 TIM barrel-domain containing protein [Candidatus Izemoplasmatales bacterium]|nr:glycoside hydrolase family 2 TIM barrel-domain containing protein [Candidatus Izemoplasmatales bacterium]
MRRQEQLNFEWYYRNDFDQKYLQNDYPLTDFEKVMIPHTNKVLPYNNFDEKDYQFISSYKRILYISEADRGQHLILKFEGIMTVASVYLNEKMIVEHEGGFTPFTVDITDDVIYGKDNYLFIKVDSHEIKNVPPFGHVVDYLCYGGIYREVSLLYRPMVYIKGGLVKTLESPKLIDSEMILDLTMYLNRDSEAQYDVKIEISKDGVNVFADTFSKTFANIIKYSMTIENIRRWEIDQPNLYTLTVNLYSNNVIIDQYHTRFGFRTAEFTTEGFVLNNRKIKLIGLNRHQSYPYVGYAMPKRIQEKDADILKYELGCNIVRTSHYMQSEHFVNRCDEIGLLVFEEIPGWQYIGNDHFKELTYQNLRDMITNHVNHPAIVLWGVRINESPDDHDFYVKTNELADQLDDSRQTGGVRNFAGSELLEHVYTYNDFSHIGNNPGLVSPIKITKRRVPYLITEHNGHIFPTKKFDPESKRTEQALRHLKVLDASFKYDVISGTIGWCMNDYNTHIEFGSGDRICYHGVMDMFRIPKYAASVYASQQRQFPVLTVASNLTMGEYSQSSLPATVIFTNCDYIKVYRNGNYIDKFYSAWKEYAHVPYAPIIVDDYFGDLILKNEGYKPTVAKRIKKVLMAFQKHGFSLPFVDKMRVANLMILHKFTFKDAENLYGKYIGDWGEDGAKYVYEGYIDDVLVKTVTKGMNSQMVITAVADDASLCHQDTYDATRIVIRMQDEYGNDLPYANNVLNISTTDELAIIGPTQIALIGGSIGVYVKTTGKVGLAMVTISCAGQADLQIPIEVK